VAWVLLGFVLLVAASLVASVATLMGAFLGGLTYLLISILVKKGISKLDAVEDDDFNDLVKNVIALPPALLVIVTSPFWNTNAYCNFTKGGSGEVLTPLIEIDINRCIQDVSGFIDSGLGVHSGLITATYWANGLLILGISMLVFFMIGSDLLSEIKSGRTLVDVLKEIKNGGSKDNSTNQTMKKKAKVGIGVAGREIVGSWNPDDSDHFNFYKNNVTDIIKLEHLTKGDFKNWFGRMGETYTVNYSKYSNKVDKAEIIGNLNWAISHIDQVYSGKASTTGQKRREYLEGIISELESL